MTKQRPNPSQSSLNWKTVLYVNRRPTPVDLEQQERNGWMWTGTLVKEEPVSEGPEQRPGGYVAYFRKLRMIHGVKPVTQLPRGPIIPGRR